MLGGFVRLIVGLGLERLLVVFDLYGLSSHLILHGFGSNSDRGNRLRPAAHLLLIRINPDIAPKIASQHIFPERYGAMNLTYSAA